MHAIIVLGIEPMDGPRLATTERTGEVFVG